MRFLVTALAACAVGAALGAELSVTALNYYRLNVKGKPQGVYEWPSEGLLFVQVRIPYTGSETPEDMESAELRLTHRELFNWMTKEAGKVRVDPVYPSGMELARRLVRELYPLWEYTAEWRFSGDCQSLSQEEQDERVYVTVCRRSDVLASMPPAFMKPVSPAVWLRGLGELIAERYVRKGELAFMWRIGALDCLDVSRRTKAVFPAWDDGDFESALRAFLEQANETWKEVDSPARDEYVEVRKGLADYLVSSEAAGRFRAEARAVALPPDKVSWSAGVPVAVLETNLVATVTTNRAEETRAITNVSVVAQSATKVLPTMTCADRVRVHAVRTDEEVVTTVETATIVRTVKTIRHKTVSSFAGDPRFERLFFGGGCLANSASARTARGIAAERMFYGTSTMEAREKVVLEALRENPGDKVLWNLYGRIFQSRKDWYGALVCFRNALRIDRDYEFALTNLADVYRAMGKRNLSVGAAVVARGLATDAWCVRHAEDVLKATW